MKEIDIKDLLINPFVKIGTDAMLITAGDIEHFNTMTASWGFVGVMWNRNVINAVIRPNRYTYEFLEKNEYFTASFFPADCKKILTFCGTHSGRDTDKIKETGLIPQKCGDSVTFSQAELTFLCKKLYTKEMDINAMDDAVKGTYEKDPVHTEFIAEIVKVFIKE
jgi:flavin reductase (DIM6/NTAB) family NADH-FMN oxidoreductase RutF